MKTRRCVAPAGIAVIVLMAGGCSAEGNSADEGAADDAAQVACSHFRNVARDADAGILSQDELREKVQEVHASGRVSDEPGIPEGTEALLAAVTQEDDAALGMAVRDLADACEDAGV